MAEIKLDADSVIGTTSLAFLFDVSPQKIRQMTLAGSLTQIVGRRGKYLLLTNVKKYHAQLRTAAAGRDFGEDMKAARLQKAKAEAVKATIQVGVMKGDLIPASEIEGRWTSAARVLRSAILALPSRIANHLNLSNEDKSYITEEIEGALSDLADNGSKQTETTT